MSNQNNMSWGDRFAVIDHFTPTDEEVCSAFALNQTELDTARVLRAAGTFVATRNLDVSQYAGVFKTPVPTITQRGNINTMTAPIATKVASATTHVVTEANEQPESASKAVKQPRKRGRKGDKILKALQSVTATRVPVDTFIQQHGVSLAVLRQAKRFVATLDAEQSSSIGKINVRQDKATKQLMIWREEV